MPALPAEPNKIDGACACGVAVPAGAGFFVRKALKLQCAACRSVDLAADAAPVPAAPAPAAPAPAAPARVVTPSLPMLLPPDDGKVKVRIYWNEKAQKAVVTVADASSRLTIEAVMRACEAHSFVHTPGLGGWAGHVESVPRLIAGLGDAGLRSEVSDNASRAMLARAEQNKRAVAGASLRIMNVGRRGRTLKEYQKRGVEFMASKDVVLNADDGGCIDGDAIVQVNRARRGFKTTLAHLYRKFNGGESRGSTWDLSIPTYVKSLVGDHLRLHRVKAVLDKGEKSVVKLTLASGKTLRLTDDHEVCTGVDHSFTAVGALRPGDSVLTNGRPKCKDCGSTNRVATYRQAKFRGYCRTCIYRKKRKNRVVNGSIITKDGYREITEGMRYHPSVVKKTNRSNGERPHTAARGVLEHRLVVEAHMNGLRLHQWLEICRANAFTDDHEFLSDDLVVHHKNGDRLDNRLRNLKAMSRLDHDVEHGRESKFANMDGGRAGKGGLICFVPKIDKVVSVKQDGVAHVYDIVCEDPWRNFVANGIVVHNCGKTAQLLCSAGPRPRIMVIAPKIMVGAIVKGRPIGGWADEAAIWRPDIERFTIIETRDEFRWPEENEIVALNFELMPVSPAELAKEATKNAEARRAALSKGVPFQEPPKKNHKVADVPPEGVELFGDEVHAFANPNSQRSKRFKHLASMVLKRKGRVRGASATPMKNNAKELYAVLDALGAAERVFGTYEAYARLHDYRPRQVAKDRVTWEFNDPSPMVAEKLKQVMIRRKKRDVLTELPPLTFRRLVVEVDRETIKACDAAMKEIERAGLDVEKAMEIVNESRAGGFDFDKISGALAALAKVKTPHALERADEFERTGTPVVFFAAHLPVVETLGKRRGWGTLVGGDAATANYDGEPVRAKGPEIARAFQSGRLDNIAATIQYAGVGITLTRASHALLVEKVWNPAAVAQAIWRIERIGQENPMVVTDMVANHPLDVRMSEVLEKKLDLYAATVDAAAVAVNDLDRREDVVSGLVQAAAKTARKPG